MSIEAHHARDRCGDAREVLRLLIQRGPATIDQVAEWMDRQPHAISGRFTPLAKDGLIIRTDRREKTRTGSTAIVWSATALALEDR
jgi:predicted ArsR family transcriptional regulator